VGSVVEEGRGDKIVVFHFKRKKQYKKLQGHRQPFTAVRITEIAFDGQKFTAPDQTLKPKKEKKEMASKQTEQKAAKKSRTGAEGKASKSSKGRTDKGTARAAKKPSKKK
jgi:large subunit ribosomal protein L21